MKLARAYSVNVPPPTLANQVVYQLNFIHGNIQRFRLVKFEEELELDDIVRLAKRYCAKNNFRFVFIEPAITLIENEEMEELA